MASNQVLELAIKLHTNGNLSEAEKLYCSLLDNSSPQYVIKTNLAAIYILKYEHRAALSLLEDALLELPTYLEALVNYGVLLTRLQRYEEAVGYLTNALIQSPAYPLALSTLLEIHKTNLHVESLSSQLSSALSLDPSNSKIISYYCEFLVYEARLEEAIEVFEQSLSSASNSDIHYMMSSFALFLLTHNIDLPRCVDLYTAAISLNPESSVRDFVNKGEALRRLRLFDKCLEWCTHALLKFPRNPLLLNLKGCIYLDLKVYSAAIETFEYGLKLDSTDFQLLSNKSLALISQGSLSDAYSTLTDALRLAPDNPQCHHSLAQCCFTLGKYQEAYFHFSQACQLSPIQLHWDNLLYFLSFTRIVDPHKSMDFFTRYSSELLPRLSLPALASYTPPPFSDTLKIGIVSAEIGDHCVSYFLASLLTGSAGLSDVEIHVFPTIERANDIFWAKIKQLATSFNPITTLSDEQAVNFIRSFKLDFLLETTQHMQHNRLPMISHRLARYQAHYIGMHGTTGCKNIDFFIADNIIVPESFSSEFTEKILRLDRTWVCYTPPDSYPDITSPTDHHLCFGSFNNFQKISDQTLALWSQLMIDLPDSILYLKDSQARVTSSLSDRALYISQYMEENGVSPSRIHFFSHCKSWDDHMNLYNQLHICLDTTPLTSGTTAFDSLFMGRPLIAYSTDWIGGRLSHSVLNGFGRSDWIASSYPEYLDAVSTTYNEIVSGTIGHAQVREQFLSSELCDSRGLSASLVRSLKTVCCV